MTALSGCSLREAVQGRLSGTSGTAFVLSAGRQPGQGRHGAGRLGDAVVLLHLVQQDHLAFGVVRNGGQSRDEVVGPTGSTIVGEERVLGPHPLRP